MVYQQKFIAVLKHNGRILRERDNNTIYLKFGSDYNIDMCNNHSEDAVVSVTIDGQDVLAGHQLVIPSGEKGELNGFMSADGTVKNQFRFINKTQEISEFRGDNIADGIIKIEFQYVQHNPYKIKCGNLLRHSDPMPHIYHMSHQTIGSGVCGATGNQGPSGPEFSSSLSNCNVSHTVSDNVTMDSFEPNADEGITVAGAETNQKFHSTFTGPLEDTKHTIVFQLRGATKENKMVRKPLYVSTKLQCKTCGRKSKSSAKACSNCGTFFTK